MSGSAPTIAGESLPEFDNDERQAPRGRLALLALLLIAIAAFVALGVWQVERRTWKLDLIDRVERRVHAAPTPAPGPGQWPQLDADDAYRHVTARGRFLPGHDIYVRAVSDLGGGYWVLSPFATERGFVVLVDRGFVPPDRRAGTTTSGAQASPTTVNGLLRLSEPGGAFLHANDPGHDRWYSRDVAAIAEAQHLGVVAPYFIDADAGPVADAWPRGGLTVISFPNNHLVYALTWFALALLGAVGIVRVYRDGTG